MIIIARNKCIILKLEHDSVIFASQRDWLRVIDAYFLRLKLKRLKLWYFVFIRVNLDDLELGEDSTLCKQC